MNKKILQTILTVALSVGVFFTITDTPAFAQQNTNSKTQTTQQKNDKKEDKVKEKAEFKANSSYKKVYDAKPATEAEVKSIMSSKSGGVTKYTYNWADENGNKIDTPPIDVGNYKLMIYVSNDDPEFKGSGVIPYIVESRPLEWDTSNLKVSKPYDATTSPAQVKGELKIKGLITGDDVVFGYDSIVSPDFPTADVQRTSVALIVNNPQITGEKAKNYSLPKIAPTVEASIINAHVIEIDANQKKYRVIVEESINITDDLVKANFDTIEKVKEALRNNINASFKDKENINIVFYNLKCQVQDNGNWLDVDKENIPAEISEITVPYPNETSGKTHEFVVNKMITNGEKSGIIEECENTETDSGLKFKYSDGDTIAVGYTEQQSKNMLITAVMVVAGAVIIGIIIITAKLIKKDEKEDLLEEVEENDI